MECIFFFFIAGEIPADVVLQDEECIAFRDIHPQAPLHVLIIPKSHIASMEEANEKHQNLLGHLLLVAKKVAEKEGVSNKGYRLTINCGPDGGQIVPHLHIHLLGGRRLDDIMG